LKIELTKNLQRFRLLPSYHTGNVTRSYRYKGKPRERN